MENCGLLPAKSRIRSELGNTPVVLMGVDLHRFLIVVIVVDADRVARSRGQSRLDTVITGFSVILKGKNRATKTNGHIIFNLFLLCLEEEEVLGQSIHHDE